MNNEHKNTKILEEQYVPTAEFYSQIIDSLQDYSIFTVDKELNINSWNSGATKIFQYTTEDIIGKPFEIIFTKKDKISGCWIVTNNRFTSDATAFAQCSGLKLLSWDYPEKMSLRKRIDEGQLYPITCLTTLTLAEKDKLLVKEVILAKEIINNTRALEEIGVSPIRIKNVIKEASELCKYI